MDQPLSAVARVASTPEQAKIFVALLQGEGIPAYIEGDSLVDEFAMSRRLMNLGCVRVMVPTASLERAGEILGPVTIDAADLEQQALAAESTPSSAEGHLVPARTAARFLAWYWLLGLPLLIWATWALL